MVTPIIQPIQSGPNHVAPQSTGLYLILMDRVNSVVRLTRLWVDTLNADRGVNIPNNVVGMGR